ncbi:MAG: phytanoyl-CoA dioxygenase family protein [Candidatus Methylomirabilales bacterium]
MKDYQKNGFVVLRSVFNEWLPTLRKGADRNHDNPSPRALIHREDSHEGRFLEDFCNWQRIPEYEDFVFNSSMGAIAARLMKSRSAQFFHDHYLHKEADTGVATPWHQDIPYYCVQGEQTVSFWIPLDAREKEVSLRCVVGSHELPKEVRPTSWSTMDNFYADDSSFMDMPDIEGGDYETEAWAMEPGDAVAFNFKTIHGAGPNTRKKRSRTVSFRVLGDDVRFLQRPGRTSPNFPGIDQKNGERLREDWFPVIWKS